MDFLTGTCGICGKDRSTGHHSTDGQYIYCFPSNKGEHMRTTIQDFDAALKRVDKLLEDNEPKHKAAWKTQTLETHSEHCRDHADQAYADVTMIEENDLFGEDLEDVEDNLASVACRGLMLLQRFLEEKAKRGL